MKIINKWRTMMPTWFICAWFFFGVFVWPMIVGVILIIIQSIQKKKIISRMNDAIMEHDVLRKKYDESRRDNENVIIEFEKDYERRILRFDNELKEKNEEISKYEENKRKSDIEIDRLNELLREKERQIESIKNNISELARKQCLEKQKEYEEKFLDKRKSYEEELSNIQSEINAAEHKLSKVKQLEDEKERLEEERGVIQEEINDIKKELKILNDETIEKYYIFSKYDSITSQDCMNKLSVLKSREKSLRNNEKDIEFIYDFESHKTKPMVTRQMLRNFNSECDNIMSSINSGNIDMIRNRIQKSYNTINNLYSVYYASITEEMLSLKLEQATLLYTAEIKKQQEKEVQKSIKEQMIEEAKAQKEIEEQKKKIEKDLQQHLSEVNRMMKYMQKAQLDAEKQFYIGKIRELEEKVKSLENDKETILEREANAKAGFVYIISNIGSFGDNIYKIGMTRRLEPMDRIKELSGASVPFEFDVHAMIFSSDAPELEATLHRHFSSNAVNKVNPRKEFYNVDIDEIEKVVKENYNDTVQFTKIPIAAEYRQSINLEEKE